MSNVVFPVLPGLMWDVKKSPRWKTSVQESVGGKELRASFMSNPIWKWQLSYEVLREEAGVQEFQNLIGFFNARQGRFDSFLYTDPGDSTVNGQSFGFGNGALTAFQLVRDYGVGANSLRESVKDLNGAPQILVNGVLKTVTTDYTVSSAGVVTFTVAPASGAALTWSGSYYWRVRFDMDLAEFNNFLSQLWEAKSITFVSVKT